MILRLIVKISRPVSDHFLPQWGKNHHVNVFRQSFKSFRLGIFFKLTSYVV